ncbi:MAG: glutathione S-transferase family protein [Proteobacteria bacterium]|nr:glutathione S-transferase family protein [Pseudomonadota bacterium]
MTEFLLWGAAGSPYFRSVLMALEEKAQPYRVRLVGIGETKGAEHLARHPFGRLPVCDHGDFRLYETQAILRYVDQVCLGAALHPDGARAQARMDQLMGIVDWYVFPQVSVPISAERIFAQRFWNRPTDEARVAAAVPQARVCINEIARLMGAAPYLTGDKVSLADLMLAPHLAYFAATPEGAMLGEAGLGGWLERMRARPSFAATEPDRVAQAA